MDYAEQRSRRSAIENIAIGVAHARRSKVGGRKRQTITGGFIRMAKPKTFETLKIV